MLVPVLSQVDAVVGQKSKSHVMVIALSSTLQLPKRALLRALIFTYSLNLATPKMQILHYMYVSLGMCVYSKGNVPTDEVTRDGNERPVRVNNH